MKASITRILTILILSTTTVIGQTYEPLELAKKIFGKNSLPNIEDYIAGEYKGRPDGRDIQKGSITKFTLLGQTDNYAVVALTILDASGKGIDTYLHFEKSTTWKMTAFRALAMTGMIERAVTQIEKMTPKQIEKMIAKYKKRNDDSMFTTRAEFDYYYGNAKLTISLDENIAEHFLKNQAAFERLKDIALAELENEKEDDEMQIKLIEDLKSEYNQIFIASVSTGGSFLGRGICFLIGGIIDNSVGYLYVKDKSDLPEMSASSVIMIREIGNGWYIFKTT